MKDEIRTAAHNSERLSLAINANGQDVAKGGDDRRLIRVSVDGAVHELEGAAGRQVDALAMSRPARARAVATGREVRLLDASGTERARMVEHPSTVSGLAFDPKGECLAIAHYGGVTLWSTANFGQASRRLEWRGSRIGVF